MAVSLKSRLALAITGVVVVVTACGMVADYWLEYRDHSARILASLGEQAKALRAARQYMNEPQFAKYVDDFCAQMNRSASPGHHILVLDKDKNVILRARHHSGAAVENALVRGSPEQPILELEDHRLAQVRVRDGKHVLVLAQYLDHMEHSLRRQLLTRAIGAGATSLGIIVLLVLLLHFWAIRPLSRLTEVAGRWARREFRTRATPAGAPEYQFLAGKLNGMAKELARHEEARLAEMNRARRIQESMMPAAPPRVPGLRVVARYVPVEQIAGDLYDIIVLTDGSVAFVVLDVVGHGVSAALLTGVMKMALRYHLADTRDPTETLARANRDLIACSDDGDFVTACVALWNPTRRTWTYSSAGQLGGVLLRQGQGVILPAQGPLLGILPDGRWTAKAVELARGDRVFVFTDGIVEAGASADILGASGLTDLLGASNGLGLAAQVDQVIRVAIARNGGKRTDDITVVAIEAKEGRLGEENSEERPGGSACLGP